MTPKELAEKKLDEMLKPYESVLDYSKTPHPTGEVGTMKRRCGKRTGFCHWCGKRAWFWNARICSDCLITKYAPKKIKEREEK